MMKNTKCWAVIPAAGTGQRMHSECPKQYLKIAGKTLLEHSLAPLLEHPSIESVMVALHAEDNYFESCAFDAQRIHHTLGAGTRAASVFNALRALASKYPVRATDFVCVHDAARPCLSRQDLTALITASMESENGCILATPMQDTVKEVVDHTIQRTLDRSRLWRALTPQMIRYQRLYDSLKRALVDQVLITDEAGALEYSGYPVDIVVGDARNIKVTTATDLPLAEMILKDMHA